MLGPTDSKIELASASSLASSAVTDECHAAQQPPVEVGEHVADVGSERGNEASASPSAAVSTSTSAPQSASPAGDGDAGSATPMAAALMPDTVSAPIDDRVDPREGQQTHAFGDKMQPTADPGPQAPPAQEEQMHSEGPQHVATAHAEEREAWIAAAAADAETPEAQERVALERQLRSIQGKVGAA